MTSEREIHADGREDLLYLLAEAAEIEHNLMCCYLFAAAGLKDESDGISPEQAQEIGRWRRALVGVAVEEMTHLGLVANLTIAIGGAPHFARPNFPVASGYHPSGVIVELHRFDRATLDHFIYLERPEGVELPDGAAYPHRDAAYVRDMGAGRLMPSAQDYATVGHLYRGIRSAIATLCAAKGEAALFIGDPALQVGPEFAALPGLARVIDLESALAALDVIVEQGEGSPADAAHSHYRRFLAIRDSYDALLAAFPGFDPSRPVAANPVMRKPPSPEGRVHVDAPEAARALDFANALYGAMLRALAQGFCERAPARKRALLDVAIEGMFAISPVARHLTRLPASPAAPGLTAGMTFAMLRDVAATPDGDAAMLTLSERLRQLAEGAARALDGAAPLAGEAAANLRRLADRLDAVRAAPPAPAPDRPVSKEIPTMATDAPPPPARARTRNRRGPGGDDPVRDETLHPCAFLRAPAARRVQGQCRRRLDRARRRDVGRGPRRGRAELPFGGHPVPSPRRRAGGGGAAGQSDPVARERPARLPRRARDRRPADRLSRDAVPLRPVAQQAVLRRRPQGRQIRRDRRTRDGDVTPLAARDGAVSIRPQRNGPLAVSGNVEVVSGTGRTIRKATALMLCRCGASGAKPYCDGSHARVGFES